MSTPQHGRIQVHDEGHSVAYRRWGTSENVLLCLHGGPAVSSRYLEPLADLADDTLSVVLYDQLGCGESDRPDDDGLWTIGRMAEEADRVRAGLGLDQVHVYGHSWGGMLGLQYVLDFPEHIASYTMSNSTASTGTLIREYMRLRAALPDEELVPLTHYESRGEVEHPDYKLAFDRLFARHTRRSIPFDLETSMTEAAPLKDYFSDIGRAYEVLWGGAGFLCTGNLVDWDLVPRLDELKMPMLVIGALYDEMGTDGQLQIAEAVTQSELVIFGRSSHLLMHERDSAAYLALIKDFVRRSQAAL